MKVYSRRLEEAKKDTRKWRKVYSRRLTTLSVLLCQIKYDLTGKRVSSCCVQRLLFSFSFSPNRPTGPIRSSSRDVRMSVCVFVCVSPSHAIFLKCWCQNGSDVECCYSLILINSCDKHHHYLLLFSYDILYLIIYLNYFNKYSLKL